MIPSAIACEVLLASVCGYAHSFHYGNQRNRGLPGLPTSPIFPTTVYPTKRATLPTSERVNRQSPNANASEKKATYRHRQGHNHTPQSRNVRRSTSPLEKIYGSDERPAARTDRYSQVSRWLTSTLPRAPGFTGRAAENAQSLQPQRRRALTGYTRSGRAAAASLSGSLSTLGASLTLRVEIREQLRHGRV